MSNQIDITGGARVRGLNGVITGTSGVLASVPLGGANGVATLDATGKVPSSQLPTLANSYKGTWNASTNTPTIADGTGTAGDYYLVSVAGTQNLGSGSITFAVGNNVIYSGTIWQKSGTAAGVTSVGLSTNGGAITIGSSPVTSAGTITANFNGTSLQYVNGAGNLTTFPTLLSSVGLSMPSAFSVANSPLTANGTIAVTGAGTTAQYIRGDGSLATFPAVASEAQRLITEVYNSTGATLTKGTVVYINGGQGNLPTVTKALATGDATSAQTYGVVQTNITNMNNGFVVAIGSLTDLDTQAYANGTQLYLSSTVAGAWTSVKQYAPAHLVYVAIVTRSHPTQGVVEVKIQNGFEMDELHDVSAQTPSNGGILQYVTSTGLWTAVAGTTTNIAEGTNLYYTDVRARASNSFVAGSGAYNSTTGVITIPTNNNQITNGSNYINLGSLSGTAPISYNSGTGAISISQSSGSTNGYLSSTDWTTFNGKENNLTFYSPLVKSGSSITIPPATSIANGYLTSTDWNTFNNKTSNTGTVTSVGLSSATSGVTIGSTPVTTSGTITLAIATATTSQNGLLSSTDWTTFNNKASTASLANYLPLAGGTLTGALGGTSASFSGNISSSGTFVGRTTNGQVLSCGNGIDTDLGIFVQTGNILFTNTGTATGFSWALGNVTKFSLVSTGNFLINTTTDAGYKLDVNGTGRFSGALSGTSATFSGSVIVGTTALLNFGATSNFVGMSGNNSTGALQLYANNTQVLVFAASTGAATFSSSVTATGFFESSDSRLKTLIEDNYQTKGIASITPKLYTKNGKVELGYYAQDFVGVLDSAISKDEDEMLSLSYREVLVAKVYALEQRIKELETKFN
jgi:hypothetical protein